MARTWFATPPALQDLRRRFQVAQAPVFAGADDHLVDLYIPHLIDGLGVFRQVRERHRRPMADRSMSITLSYTASSSASYTVNGRFTRPLYILQRNLIHRKMPFFAPASIAMLAILQPVLHRKAL